MKCSFGFLLVCLGLVFLVPNGASAKRPIARFKYKDSSIYAGWYAPRTSAVPSDQKCIDYVFVSAVDVRYVEWDRDSKQHRVTSFGPDVNYGLDSGSDPECLEYFGYLSTDPRTVSKSQVKWNGTTGASIDINDFATGNGLYGVSLDLHLRFAGQGAAKTKSNYCSVIPDPVTNTCLKVTSKWDARPQTVTGDVSGELIIPGAIGRPTESRVTDWTPGNFSAANPDSIFVSKLNAVNVEVLDVAQGGCNCPSPHEEIVE